VLPDDPELQTTAEQVPKAVVDVAAPTGAHVGRTETVKLKLQASGRVVLVRAAVTHRLHAYIALLYSSNTRILGMYRA
jgi:hypothetical protein